MLYQRLIVAVFIALCLVVPSKGRLQAKTEESKTPAEVNALLRQMAQRYQTVDSFIGSFSTETSNEWGSAEQTTSGTLIFRKPNFYVKDTITYVREAKTKKAVRVQRSRVVSDGTSVFTHISNDLQAAPHYSKRQAQRVEGETSGIGQGAVSILPQLILGDAFTLRKLQGNLVGLPVDSLELGNYRVSAPPSWKVGTFLRAPVTMVHFVEERIDDRNVAGRYEPSLTYRNNHNFHIGDGGILFCHEYTNLFEGIESRSKTVWSEIQINSDIAPSIFHFTPPPGAIIKELVEK